MNELIAQLRRIADELEVQNHLYAERCAKMDVDDKAAEKRRFKHEFEVVEAQFSARTEQLKLERENMKLAMQFYAEHPDHLPLHAAALNKALDEQSQPDDSTSEG